MTDRSRMPDSRLPGLLCYEELLAGQSPSIDWPTFDENTAAGLCYTSGTTGNPKGVLYSHRSNVLHALSVALSARDVRLSQDDQVLPVVPLFHVNAWGLPYVAPLTGTTLIFPGPGLDGASLFDLMESERVTAAWGVPTVWLGLLAEMDRRDAKPKDLEAVLVGGSAAPRPMIDAFERRWGLDVVHGWGMTEMSPIGTLGVLRSDQAAWPLERRLALKERQGRRMFQVEMKIVDGAGLSLPHDGVARGELLVRGPFITSGYFGSEDAGEEGFDEQGWFRTGDVATIDADGYLSIVDRIKDIIKSGGEWISSIDVENAAIGHPAVLEAAVIGLPHPKWSERPLLVVVRHDGIEVSKEEIIDYLRDKMAKWWLPDDIVFVDSLPHSATGKLQKAKLRELFKDHVLPGAAE